jgi:sugar phosphate isomerase/epimerase
VTLGLDVYSVRSETWTAFEFLDYAARLGAGLVHFSEPRFLGPLDESHLRPVKDHADRLGLRLEVGMCSICPTSHRFDPAQGTAEEQIVPMLGVARVLGSPILRAFLGDWKDRPVERHLESVAHVLRSVRSRVIDAGVKIAVENHAGDMQARELKMLIEEAGPDFVGACLDSGNPVWALEDPFLTLETLAPYVLTTHVRDSAVWEVPEGIAFQWRVLGEGTVGIDRWIARFVELCPGRPLSLEIITGRAPWVHRVWEPEFWGAFPNTPAWEFSRFLRLARQGAALAAAPASSRENDRAALERSVCYVRSGCFPRSTPEIPAASRRPRRSRR